MKLKLVSDFTDYYDHWFDNEADHKFRRMTTEGDDRLGQLRFMESLGLKVPRYGRVLDLDCERLVVYTDLRAHCGEGKELVSNSNARTLFPECYATEYIGDVPGLSWRYLQVGLHGFWIEYRSNYTWKSNCGDLVTLQIIGRDNSPCVCKLPLFAIDFVVGKELYAVDFNIAPGIQGTGVERLLPPKHAAEAIKEAYEKLLDRPHRCQENSAKTGNLPEPVD